MIRPPRFAAGSAWLAAAIRRSVALCASVEPRVASQDAGAGARNWPAITRETKPWTRWWWQGSAVEPDSLTAQLEALKAAGIGGVEITPIYGVRGAEDRFIPYSRTQWMRMLEHTLREATAAGSRRRHGDRHRLAVRRAVGRRRHLAAIDRAQDVGARCRRAVDRTCPPASGAARPRAWAIRSTSSTKARLAIRRAPAPQQPVIRSDARAIQITDLADPVSANKNLQALALEQVKYPRDLPLTRVDGVRRVGRRAGSDGARRSRRHARLDGARRHVDALRALSSDGTASWSSARRPAAKAT